MSGAPTSNNATVDGNKTTCPAQAHKTCHVKSLTVTVHPKSRASAPSSKNTMLTGEMAPYEAAKEYQKKLKADLTNNRIAAPAVDLVKKHQLEREIVAGVGAARQSAVDAVDQTKAAGQQAIRNRSLQGVQGPRGPTADQRAAMGKVPGATKDLTLAHLQKAWDREAFELLQRYDLVIETVAGFYNDSETAVKSGGAKAVSTVDIRIEAEAEGVCPCNKHLYVSGQSNTNTGIQYIRSTPPPIGFDGTNYKLNPAAWKKGEGKIELVDVMAATVGADTQATSNPLVALIKVLMMGFQVIKPLDYEITLHTCGHLTSKTVDPAQLNALVRIYRETTFAIGVKIPPFKKVERSTIRTAPRSKVLSEAETITTRDYLFKGGNQKTETKTSHYASPGTTTKTSDVDDFQIFFKLNDVEINISEAISKTKKNTTELLYDSKDKAQVGNVKAVGSGIATTAKTGAGLAAQGASDTAFLMKTGIGFGDLDSLAGVRAGVGGAIDGFRLGMLITFKSIYRAWQAADILKHILAFMERFPQCGFKVTVQWSFLEGKFQASVGTAQGSGFKALSPVLQAAENRFIPIGWKFKVNVGCVLVAGKLEASFGILIDFSVIGRAEARVVGQIAGSIELKGFEADAQRGEAANINSVLAGKLSGRLFAVAAVESWIYTTKAEIGIEAGIAAEGGVKVKFKDPVDAKILVKAWTMPVQWYFLAENSRTGVRDGKVHVLCEQKEIFSADHAF